MRKNLWMLAAILICGTTMMFTSCSSVDNPTGGPTKEEKNPDRAVFEKILSDRHVLVASFPLPFSCLSLFKYL